MGWIPTNKLVEFGSPELQTKVIPSKLTAFNNIANVRRSLSSNGIGELKEWRSDGAGGFISITDYYRFGEASTNGLDNNLAYYLESDNQEFAKKLSLVLNINNNERLDAISKFKNISMKTFKALNLELPSGLNKSLTHPSSFTFENNQYTVRLSKEDNNIESWKLVIESK